MRETAKIHETATALLALVNEQVPKKPSYWHGTPDDYDFPLSASAYMPFWNALCEIIEATQPDED